MKNNHSLFKDCLALYPSGVTAITLYDDLLHKIGVTISSFSSLSLEPEMVMFALKRSSYVHSFFKKNTNICINILAKNQVSECLSFTQPHNIDWLKIAHTTNNDFIHLTGAVAHIECSVADIIAAGDHSIIIAKANSYHFDSNIQPLIYHNRKFKEL
jgi:3-hydroxy-9,10-secoandrosta-1,3,5(10)-triene-9,17-dione monooxygenase reductase component